LENVKAWYWIGYTYANFVSVGNMDADGNVEIVTGGRYQDVARDVAQLCVWNGATLALENVQTWYWTSHTAINSISAVDVEGDTKIEIVTGGYYSNGTHNIAQLCVWA
jgi:hypothetical protein